MPGYLKLLVLLLVYTSSVISVQNDSDVMHYTTSKCRAPEESEYWKIPRCYCDQNCVVYGDCCRTSEFFTPEEQKWGVSSASCVDVTGMSFYAMVVTFCPSDWQDKHTIQHCQHRTSMYSDPVMQIPVTSSRTKTTYLNIYCAICHRDFNPKTDIVWTITFNCMSHPIDYKAIPSQIDLDEFQKTSSELYFDEEKNEWQVDTGTELLTCPISILIPPMAWEVLRFCKAGLQGTCDPRWTDSVVRDQCESHTDLVCAQFKVYRNKFCAECNHETKTLRDCEKDSGLHPHVSGITFTILLDWSAQPNTKSCRKHEIYDPIRKECRSGVSSEKARIKSMPVEPEDVSARRNYTEQGVIKEEHTTIDSADTFAINETEDDTGMPQDVLAIISHVFIAVSILFLVLHLAVFLATPNIKNLASINLASLSISLLVLYSCFISISFTETPCMALAVIMHFSLLVCFCWMSVISFDVCRVIVDSTRSLKRNTGIKWKRFCVYSLIALAVPAALVATALLLQILEVDTDFSPDYGVTNCWISSRNALLVFVVVPLVVVMFLNLYFFLRSAWLIHTTKSQAACNSTATTDFRLFARLAIIMGLTWITGVIAAFARVTVLWYLFVVLNTLQGLFIFVAFSCSRRIWKEISENLIDVAPAPNLPTSEKPIPLLPRRPPLKN